MTVTSLSGRYSSVLAVAGNFISREPRFAWLTIGTLSFVPVLLFLAGVDERTLNGVNVWQKPLKFHIATAVFTGTLVWFCAWIDRSVTSRWWYRGYVWVLVLCVVVELLWLWGAAALGEPAHFNRTHAVLAPAYPVMGVIAVTLTSGALFVAWLVGTNKRSTLNSYFRWMVIAGLVISFLFTVIIAGELASMESHWIGGTQSDANGIWLFGWSRDGGDLRVAHFFSLHAMQFLPLIALVPVPQAISNHPRWTALVISVVYMVLILYTYFQAKMGLPFLPWLSPW